MGKESLFQKMDENMMALGSKIKRMVTGKRHIQVGVVITVFSKLEKCMGLALLYGINKAI